MDSVVKMDKNERIQVTFGKPQQKLGVDQTTEGRQRVMSKTAAGFRPQGLVYKVACARFGRVGNKRRIYMSFITS